MTLEAKVKKKVVNVIKGHKAYYFYPVTGGFGRSGIPDIVVCHCGHFIGIECKAGRNKPTALQEAELAKIKEAGGSSMWVNEETIYLVDEVLKAIGEKYGNERPII